MKNLLTISVLLLIIFPAFADNNDNIDYSTINSSPDRRRNYIIPPQPVLPDDENSIQLNSSPDRRRHELIPPHPVNPQNPINFSKSVDLKNLKNFYEIIVYNLNGIKINCDINSLPSGKYLILLNDGENIIKEKIVILK